MAVPNTTTFSLEDVLNEVFGSAHTHPKSLGDAFASAKSYKFDPAYIGSKDRLSNFRNYGAGLAANRIGIINIATRPFYIGAQPALGSVKENHFHVFYITGASYDDSNPLNITKYVCKSSDDSTWFGGGASNIYFVNTARPAMIDILNVDMQTMLSAMNFYFKINNNGNLLQSLNENIYYIAGTANLRMDSSLVAGSTTPPTMSLSESSLEFDGSLDPITTDEFDITADGDWVIIIEEEDISVNKWWGSGNDTIAITVSAYDLDISDAIKVYSMKNAYSYIAIKSYVPGYVPEYLGYISWSFDYESSGTLYFVAFNGTYSPYEKNGESSTLIWEARDSYGNYVDGGQVDSGTLDAQDSSNPTDAVNNWGNVTSLWGKVSGGDWVQLM